MEITIALLALLNVFFILFIFILRKIYLSVIKELRSLSGDHLSAFNNKPEYIYSPQLNEIIVINSQIKGVISQISLDNIKKLR